MIETSAPTTTSSAVANRSQPLGAPRPGTIFARALLDALPSIITWSVGYSVLLCAVVVLYPILEENNTLVGVLSGLGLLDAITNNESIDTRALGTFPGYLALEALAWGPLLLSMYVVPQTLRHTIGEEKNGTLDLLLSTPLPRWRFLVEKTLSVLVGLSAVLLVMWSVLIVSTNLVDGSELTLRQATAGIVHLLPVLLVTLGLTVLLTTLLRDPRTIAGIVALFLLSSFFISSLADATGSPPLEFISIVSIFHYYSSITAMLDGIQPVHDLGLSLVGVVFFLLALVAFQRRDLGV